LTPGTGRLPGVVMIRWMGVRLVEALMWGIAIGLVVGA
jgi:hypothetical protein